MRGDARWEEGQGGKRGKVERGARWKEGPGGSRRQPQDIGKALETSPPPIGDAAKMDFIKGPPD